MPSSKYALDLLPPPIVTVSPPMLPGVIANKSVGKRGVGSMEMRSWVRTSPTSVLDTSISGASPVIVIISSKAPISSTGLMVTVAPMFTTMPERSNVLYCSAVTLMTYSPIGR